MTFLNLTIKQWLVAIIMTIVIWFGFSAFFGLVSNIYHFLDGFIWAFFAGVIAFFVAIWLVILMWYIAIFTVVVIIAITSIIAEKFRK